MYQCLNITTEIEGRGCAILIRGIIPTHNLEKIKENRNNKTTNLTNGPAKLVQGLNINFKLNDTLLNKQSLIISNKKYIPTKIITTPRIGISKAKNIRWRFTF